MKNCHSRSPRMLDSEGSLSCSRSLPSSMKARDSSPTCLVKYLITIHERERPVSLHVERKCLYLFRKRVQETKLAFAFEMYFSFVLLVLSDNILPYKLHEIIPGGLPSKCRNRRTRVWSSRNVELARTRFRRIQMEMNLPKSFLFFFPFFTHRKLRVSSSLLVAMTLK